MKPTAKQIEVILLFKSHLAHLAQSNDITSPTILSDFDEALWDSDLKKNLNDRFSDAFESIVHAVKDVREVSP